MPLTLLAPQDYRVMPWRNGQGTTFELAREDGPGEAGFLWRVSRADVTRSGPFSNFPGIDRTLLLLSGAGLTLAFGDGKLELEKRYQMASFAGDEPVECTLRDGACMDFNIMVERSRARTDVTICGAAFVGHAASRTLMHVFEGEWLLEFGGAETEIPKDSLAMLMGEFGKPYAVNGSGVLLRVDIEFL